MRVSLILATCVCLLTCAPAHAQDSIGSESADTGRFQWGPMRFTPSIEVTNVGIDTNVFNDAGQPAQDVTAALGPALNVWLNVKATRIVAKTSAHYLYFKDAIGERSWGSTNELRWSFPLARMTPYVEGAYTTTRQRPGYEIDERARQRHARVSVGTDVRFSPKTSVVVMARAGELRFDEDAVVDGTSLSESLDRRSEEGEVQFRYKLTPLTTFVVRAVATRDRFVNQAVRNSNSLRVAPGFEVKPFALISGTGFVGMRRLAALDQTLPDYQGMVGQADARYEIASTQFQVKLLRDLEYSFEVSQPYYALSDLTFSVTQRVTHHFDVVGRTGRQALDYRNVTTESAASTPPRTDTGRLLGAGVGYRVGSTLRVGFDVDHYQRQSPLADRNYDGFRMAGSISYGLPQ